MIAEFIDFSFIYKFFLLKIVFSSRLNKNIRVERPVIPILEREHVAETH